jgi:hypothetical protein
MLNPLIDSENITKSDKQKSDDKENQSGETSDDCSWCIWCNFDCLFMCCLG